MKEKGFATLTAIVAAATVLLGGLTFVVGANKINSLSSARKSMDSLIKKNSFYVTGKEILGADARNDVYLIAKTKEGGYLFLKIVRGSLEDNRYTDDVVAVSPSGKLIDVNSNSYLPDITLKNGTETQGEIVSRMVGILKLKDGRYISVDLANAHVDRGFINGIFSGRIIEGGYNIAGNVENLDVKDVRVLATTSYVSPVLGTIAEVLKHEVGQEDASGNVLAAASVPERAPAFAYSFGGRTVVADPTTGSYTVMGIEEPALSLNVVKELVNASVVPIVSQVVTQKIDTAGGKISILPSIVTSSDIKDLTITASDIADGTITSAKLASGVGGTPGDDSVTGAKIKNGEVGEADLAGDSVTESKLKAVDAASDEECLTYETTTGDFEWQSCGGGGSGTITAITAGSGLTGGGSSGSVTLTIDDSQEFTDIALSDSSAPLTFSNSGFFSCTALETDSSGKVVCGTDDGGAGSGIATLQVDDVNVVSSASVLDFLGTDFDLTNSPAGEGNLSIDYTNSKIVRSDSSDTLTNKTIAAGTNTISGLTNSNLSGTAGIANANLANSSVTINSSGILSGGGALSLGGSLTLTATEADTLTSVTGRNASTSNGITLSSASPITFSGTTPTITFSGGDTIFDLTGAATRTLSILNSTAAQVAGLSVEGEISASNFSGSSSGTNTGDNAANSTYASDYRAANFIAGTNYLAPSGSAASLTNFPTLNQNTTGTASNITGVLGATSFPAMTGDVSNTQGSLTTAIGSGAVTLAKMANLAANSIIGNNTGDAATPIALTSSQVKTLLSISTTDVSGLGTTATQSAGNIFVTGGQIIGGTINGVAIGGTSPSTGVFTTLSATGAITAPTSTNTINGLVVSSGALSGISTISTSGAINGATLSGGTLSGGSLSGTTLSGTGSFTITGGTGASETLTLISSSHETKGDIQFFSSSNKITSGGALTIAGALSASNISGSTSGNNTGDQTITLQGDVTGTGTGTFTTTIADSSIDYQDLDIIDGDSATNGDCLTYDTGTGGSFEWVSCGGSGISNIDENNASVLGSATSIDFLGTDFVVTADGTEGDISIDYTNSKIVRSDQNESITGSWTLGDANTDTLTIKAGSSGTGITLFDSSFANCSALETAGGVLTCGSDDTGVGGGIATIQVGDADAVTSATAIDFLAADFDVTNSPAGEGNISIDYSNSKITRTDQNQTITGDWSFGTLTSSGDLSVAKYATISGSLGLGNATAAIGPGHLNMSGTLTVAGAISGSNVSGSTSGTNTGDQTITLQGDVTGTGTGTFTTTIADSSIDYQDLDIIDGDSATNGDCLSYDTGAGGSFEWVSCGGGSGISNIDENNASVVGSATSIDFLGTDFVVTADGTEGDISIDYTNSKIVRSDQAETITGGWSFTTGTTTITTSDINGGAIDGTTIGANSAAAGTFTTLTSTGTIDLSSDVGADTITIGQSGTNDDTVTIAGALSLTDDHWSITEAGVGTFITGSVLGSTTFTTNNIADSGALTIKSATANALTLDSGTTGAVNIGTGASGKAVNIATDDTTKDTISIGSLKDDLAIVSDSWSVTNAGAAAFASITEGGTALSSIYAPIGADYITVAANGTLTGETAIGALSAAISTTSTLNVDSASTLNAITLDAGANFAMADGVGTFVQTFSPLGTTAAPKGLTITPKFTADAADQTLSALYINPNTNTNNDSGDILYALNIENIADSTAVESAIRVGSGWNNVMDINGTNLTAAELGYLDGHDAALIDTNDTATTAITGVGTLTTLTVSGAITGATSTNTINGIVINSGTITGATIAAGSNTLSGITASNMTAGDFSSAINSGSYSINVSGSAGTVTGFSPTSGKTLTVQKSMTLTSADDTGVYTLPTGTKTLAATDVSTLSSLTSIGTLSSLSVSGAITGATATDTINGLIINSGALSGATTLGLSGAITGATATNTINGIIINSGAVSGMTTLSSSGDWTWTATTPSITINDNETLVITDASTPDTFTINTSGSLFSYSDGTNSFTFDADTGPSYAGTARPIKKVTLVPEYPGAVLTGDTSNNSGTMTSDFCSTVRNINENATPSNAAPCDADLTEEHNYYSWETTQGTAQDYDVWITWQVPSDFSEFSGATAISFENWASTANSSVALNIYDNDGDLCGAGSTVTGTGQWASSNYVDPTGCDAANGIEAGEEITLRVTLTANSSTETAKVGEIGISYYAKF